MNIEESYENISIEQIRSEILRFKNDIISQQLDQYYNTKSFSEILGVSRKELGHSNFIAWLLNEQESHNLGAYPLKKFLEILVIASLDYHSLNNKDIFDSIITGDISIKSLTIDTEKYIAGIGRVDIYIETELFDSSGTHKLSIT